MLTTYEQETLVNAEMSATASYYMYEYGVMDGEVLVGDAVVVTIV